MTDKAVYPESQSGPTPDDNVHADKLADAAAAAVRLAYAWDEFWQTVKRLGKNND